MRITQKTSPTSSKFIKPKSKTKRNKRKKIIKIHLRPPLEQVIVTTPTDPLPLRIPWNPATKTHDSLLRRGNGQPMVPWEP